MGLERNPKSFTKQTAYTTTGIEIMGRPDLDKAGHFDAAHFVLKRRDFDLYNIDAFDLEYKPNEGDLIEFHFMELGDTEVLQESFV